MKILWTRSEKPLSKIIRALTKEPVSHVVILCDEFVIQANLFGLHVISEAKFRAECEVVFELQLLSDKIEKIRLKALLKKHEGSLYDFGALLFIGMRYVAKIWLKMPFPKANLWQHSGMFMCTEWVSDVIEEKEDSLITPFGLYKRLKERYAIS